MKKPRLPPKQTNKKKIIVGKLMVAIHTKWIRNLESEGYRQENCLVNGTMV